MKNNALLALEGFTCIRSNAPLFKPVTCSLYSGETMHLQAANGTGKTTLLKAVYGMAVETTGTIYWQGQPVRRLAGICEYINDRNGCIAHLNASEALNKMMIFAGMETTAAQRQRLLADCGLTNPERMFSDLSKGQRKRLHLVRLRLSAKKLWLLDEPFEGLDTQGRRLLLELMAYHLAHNKGAILYTAHLPDGEKQYHPHQSQTLTGI